MATKRLCLERKRIENQASSGAYRALLPCLMSRPDYLGSSTEN